VDSVARLYRSGEFASPGEERVAAYLERQLPEAWAVICNKELVDPTGATREIDFVVIGQHAVFVVEEKSWTGPIHGNENGWVLRTGESVVSPLQTAEANARRLAGLLRSNVPMLQERVSGHFVFARVLLSGEARLFVHDRRTSDQVLRLEGCDEELERFDRLQGSIVSIGAFRERIIRQLTGLADRPTIPRRVGDFEVLESLGASGPLRTLRGKHRDGSIRTLKLLARPTTADPEKRELIDSVLLREYGALRQLSASGRAPAVDPYFSWDQEQYWVLPIHLLDGRSLRADRADAAPQADRIWAVLEDAAKGLAAVHDAGVIHRALTPDRIYVRSTGAVAFSDFVIARIEGQDTVAAHAVEIDSENAYRAPECRVDLGLADARSDVHGLVASILFWVTGNEPEPSGQLFPPVGSIRSDLPEPLAELLDRVSLECLAEDERRRPTAAELAELVKSAHRSAASTSGAAPAAPTGEVEPGAVIADQYRVLRKLGEGATAVTYLVEDLVAETLFVLKRIRNPELISRLSRAEFRSLMTLHHPNLPRVFDVRPPDSPFHLKLEYIPGSPLRHLAPTFHGSMDACLRVGYQVLEALAYLGARNLIHRDVSPNNILVPDEETEKVKLIDFGLATAESDASSAVGTPRYRAPEVERGARWTPSCDLYSLAVVLFELLVGRLPYRTMHGAADKHAIVPPTADEEARFGGQLLRALVKGASPDPRARFQTAEEFVNALREAVVAESMVPAEGREEVNPFVAQLRGAYRNSRIGNAENRGLDSDFARQTYVPTRLDTDLLPRLLEGRYQLVILAGNPGDGKTAFLQRLHDELVARGGQAERKSEAGWRLHLGDRVYAALYDASESHQGKSANTLLNDVLEPLAGPEPIEAPYTAAIAVNDGRLYDFFDRYGENWYPWIWKRIRAQRDGEIDDDERVVLVDLKSRSLIREIPDEPTVFSRILEEFVARDRWHICEGCVARLECPIRLNALTFQDSVLGPMVRRRLHILLFAVHLRRERRPTIRDLRSALAYLITHNLGCEEVHKERQESIVPVGNPSRLYFNATFDGSGGPDLLLEECSQLDPASVASPRLDRFLHFHRQQDQANTVRALFHDPAGRPDLLATAVSNDFRAWIATMKRRYFFEGATSPDHLTQWDLPLPETLLPYWHLEGFAAALAGKHEDPKLLQRLLDGISRADGVPKHASRGGLALRVSETSTEDFVVIKRFPPDEFQLQRPPRGGKYAEGVPDQLVLRHRSGSPSLVIGLDLYEFLERAADGYLPGPEEQRALIEDLSVFKNLLLAQPTREAIVVEGGRRGHYVRVHEGKIRREEAAG
jgi:serine/threonine protein kinase